MYRVIKRGLALMAVIAAFAAVSAPLASARFEVVGSSTSSAPVGQVSQPVAQDTGSDGFAWGDAAIGAAVTITVLGLGTAAVMGARHRHAHHAATS